MATAYKTNIVGLEELLKQCQSGELQLSDFQRSWVWDDERIRGLIAPSQASPVGALMTLETGGEVEFKPRPVQGAPEWAAQRKPSALLLDGQQRMTSLHQTTLRNQVVETVTPRQVKVRRYYYTDIRKALDPDAIRQNAIIGVPEDRRVKSGFKVELDVSSAEQEYEHLMFPVAKIFDWDDWQDGFKDHWDGRDAGLAGVFRQFRLDVLKNITDFQVPVITLAQTTTKEAVDLVFEKVNTGGKALDAFELVTAMYADGAERDRFCTARSFVAPKAEIEAAGEDLSLNRYKETCCKLQAAADLHRRIGMQEALAALQFDAEQQAETGGEGCRPSSLVRPVDEVQVRPLLFALAEVD